MGSAYQIFGRSVPGHYLAMGTFGLIGAAAVYAKSGGAPKEAAPQVQAESSDEEKFIFDYLKKAEEEAKH